MSDQTDILSTAARQGAPKLVNRDREMIPTVLLKAMLILALSALAITIYAVMTDRPLVGQPLPAPVTSERTIILDGDTTGAVTVLTPDGTILADTGPETSGFLAVVWRAMARDRTQHGVSTLAPLTLTEHANGRLVLTDPETGWSVELSSFGTDNKGAFAAFID